MDYQKLQELYSLKMGDTFAYYHYGKEEQAEFISLKRTKIVGKFGDKAYSIPIEAFSRVVARTEKEPPNVDKANLKEGELFYIEKNCQALLFEFTKLTSTKIHGKSVITGGNATIDKSMYAGKVSDLLKVSVKEPPQNKATPKPTDYFE